MFSDAALLLFTRALSPSTPLEPPAGTPTSTTSGLVFAHAHRQQYELLAHISVRKCIIDDWNVVLRFRMHRSRANAAIRRIWKPESAGEQIQR